MTQNKNKHTEEYKRQQTFLKGIETYHNNATENNSDAQMIQEKARTAFTKRIERLDYKERLELFTLREENQRMIKEIEVLIDALLVLGDRAKATRTNEI